MYYIYYSKSEVVINILQPLYHQPSDTEVYKENKEKYVTFKSQLLEYFRKRQESKSAREQKMTQTYTRLMAEWTKRVDRV